MTRLLALLVGTFIASPVAATTLEYKSVHDLAREADAVVVGTVQRVEARAAGETVFSYVTIGDLELLRGAYDGKEVTLRIEGGRTGRTGVRVEGAPGFAPGERVILFVQGNGRLAVPFVGWGQGVFRVVTDESGIQRVTDDLGNPVLSIEGGQVLTEPKMQRKERIAGAPEQRSGGSETSPGRSEGGETLPEPASRPEPLTLERFRRALEPFLSETGARGGLQSASPDAPPEARNPRDAAAPGSERAPETKPMPSGEAPLDEPKAEPAPEPQSD